MPILDNFELALKTVSKEAGAGLSSDVLIKGIELIYAQLNTLLENNGVTVIKTEREKFDPYYHEALMKVESEFPENTVLEELQRGFTLHGKIIRHAKVKVSAGKKSAEGNLTKK